LTVGVALGVTVVVYGSLIVNVPDPVKMPQPLTRPVPVTVPDETKLIMSMKPAGQTVPEPIMVAVPVPSPQAVSVALPVKMPVVASMVPQPITVGAQPETVPVDVTAG